MVLLKFNFFNKILNFSINSFHFLVIQNKTKNIFITMNIFTQTLSIYAFKFNMDKMGIFLDFS